MDRSGCAANLNSCLDRALDGREDSNLRVKPIFERLSLACNVPLGLSEQYQHQ
jgi:hypothetical protein